MLLIVFTRDSNYSNMWHNVCMIQKYLSALKLTFLKIFQSGNLWYTGYSVVEFYVWLVVSKNLNAKMFQIVYMWRLSVLHIYLCHIVMYIAMLLLKNVVECVWNLMAHGDAREGKWRGNWRMKCVASTLTLPRNVVYPALLPLIRTPRLPAVDWTDAPADLNGLVRFGERRNLVSARVPSHFKRSLRPLGTGRYWLHLQWQFLFNVISNCVAAVDVLWGIFSHKTHPRFPATRWRGY
jgi:hypothetical protein